MTTFLEQQEDLRRLLPGASKQVYQISYRIKKVGRTPEYSKIYNDFIGLIEKLQNEPLHDATSSFIVQSYHKKSAELL
jgi:hypothetical protein